MHTKPQVVTPAQRLDLKYTTLSAVMTIALNYTSFHINYLHKLMHCVKYFQNGYYQKMQ